MNATKRTIMRGGKTNEILKVTQSNTQRKIIEGTMEGKNKVLQKEGPFRKRRQDRTRKKRRIPIRYLKKRGVEKSELI